MSSPKLEVQWSPVHHDKFIVWGPDITLYEVSRLKEIEKKTTFTQISPTRGATVIASHSATGVRCVDISAIAEQPDPLLALGYSSGKVALATLKQTYDPLGLTGREFVPRYPRLCNSVSWSHVETNLLACALEKHRSDHCILLWDVNRAPSAADDQAGTSSGQSESPKPLAEMLLSETAHSVSWAFSHNRTLVASTNLKHIKIFDLRDLSNKAVLMTTTRYCYGACADPFNPWRLASRGDHVVCVWDSRALHTPLHTLPQPHTVHRVTWCPTRRNLVLSVQRESATLRLHDIQRANDDHNAADSSVDSSTQAIEAEAEEPPRSAETGGAIERDVAPGGGAGGGAGGGGGSWRAAAWHGAHVARLLAIDHAGNIHLYTVCERVTVSWGARGALWWGGGGGALRVARPHEGGVGDVSHLMRRRAQTDYGLKPDLWQNADLADDETLSGLWHFLALSRSLVEDGCIRNCPWKHPGVRGVLTAPGGEAGRYRSECVPSLLPDLPKRSVTVYRSGLRVWALQLCGWGWGWDAAGAGVERAEAEGTPCRAAALAAFHLRLRQAVDVLARAREPQLRVVALALAGLSEERLWREALAAAAPALPDAYLRALLHFLAASESASAPPTNAQPDLSAVLNETEMRLEDRVAFACIFLSDAKLLDYVQATCDALVEAGDLSGILLTGSSPEGIALLQRWVENTGDVQTAALVAARCFTPEQLQSARVAHWLDSYRNLLDSWQLWWARCALDTWAEGAGAGGAAGGGGGGGGRVALCCTYCGKSVAAAPGPRRQAIARLPPPAAKMKQTSSCPHCRKPLPRCAVCGLHVGTGGGGGGGGGGGAPFSRWVSWCGACRHAGHAQHLIDWFKEHAECPVSSCNCHCGSLDPPDRV